MKLLRYGPKGAEKPGALDAGGVIRDLSGVSADFEGDAVSCEMIAKLKGLDLSSLPAVEGEPRIGSCVARAPNFFCIGLNYARHAAETGATPPTEPIIFAKATSALSGPFDDVIIPKGSTKPDWETELGVVIGAHVEHVSEADALSVVAGYCVINDVSERCWQLERGPTWMKGKSAPTFGPTGPWLVTADEVPDPQALELYLELSGGMVQKSTTADMIFSVRQIVSYMSSLFALQPGDIIATGTPEGVGMGMKPQRWLKPGDVMRTGVEGLGEQKTKVVAYSG
ncbi:fumarylacetoacetate hydrolase family protein [Pikeienuella piscinae]|uniref:Fumarylacetoacetate hydrolase family protein n=1 Tax=Pikeienuella piscinae TaxID=2748098 RepID=A0A7L5BXV9_9RHOB|nr:fumarylacetoacetate hydrolase family protein [Pikeienuella piscinae]QIE55973.1 fumarylacetoacetate hydrolase family protein [Pikeienuella piscinae]